MALLALLCYSSYSNAEEFIEPGSDGATQHTIYDDGHVRIDLPFEFMMYDKVMTSSYMMSNGVIVMVGTNINTYPMSSFCCSGQDVASMAANGQISGQPYFNYSIAALWTDLIDLNVDVDGDGIDDSGFFTKELDTDNDGSVDTLRYYWRYISEYYSTEALNTFGVEINDSNAIEIHHFDINIRNHTVTTGIYGDTSAGEIQQFEYKQGSWDDGTTTVYTFNLKAACAANPLISPTCDGYADAYAELLYNNACAADPLYDSGCPGYAQAYFNQQCELDALYDETCPGYETAYYNTYIKPDLDRQIEEAVGIDTNTDTSTDIASTTNVVESLTEVSVTGDATVDEVLRDTIDVTDITVFDTVGTMDVPDTPTEEVTQEIEIAEQEQEQEEIIEITMLEEGQDEGENESSSDVDERMDDSGNEESPGSEPADDASSSEGSSDTDGEGKSESGKSNSKDAKESKESKREKLKKAVTKRAMALASRMSKAKTLEMQQAVQAQVLALINYVPDFGQYGGNITGGYYPDVGGYQDSQLPENNKGLRNGLAQQLLHQQMVDMQYERD